jgi:hypothetical protein
MPHCRHCGTAITLGEPIGREATCESCGRDLRSCRQCRHYDPKHSNQCRETEAELVLDKDRRNFCEFYALNPAPWTTPAAGADRERQARARLESLFDKGGPGLTPDRKADAKARLEDLFKKKPAEPPEP